MRFLIAGERCETMPRLDVSSPAVTRLQSFLRLIIISIYSPLKGRLLAIDSSSTTIISCFHRRWGARERKRFFGIT